MGNDYYSPTFVKFIEVFNYGSLILGIEGISSFIEEDKVRVLIYNDSVKLKVVQSDLSGQQSQPMIYFLNYFEMRRFSVSRNNC